MAQVYEIVGSVGQGMPTSAILVDKNVKSVTRKVLGMREYRHAKVPGSMDEGVQACSPAILHFPQLWLH